MKHTPQNLAKIASRYSSLNKDKARAQVNKPKDVVKLNVKYFTFTGLQQPQFQEGSYRRSTRRGPAPASNQPTQETWTR